MESPQPEFTPPLDPDSQEEIRFLKKEKENWDAIVQEIRVPLARRIMSQGSWLLLEAILYLICLGFLGLAWFSPKIYPFYLLEEFLTAREYLPLGRTTAEDLQLAQVLLLLLVGLLFFLLARMARMVRAKNAQLHRWAEEARAGSLRLEKRMEERKQDFSAPPPGQDPPSPPPPPAGDQFF